MEDDGALLAVRGMTRFACLGGACEDTCCASWNVSVDALHYGTLRARMAAAGEGGRFDEAFALLPEPERCPYAHATIRMRPSDGCCPLLGADGLCDAHRRFGDEALPDVCSFYPRFVVEVQGRAELLGSLSCPEVARQLLLHDDGLELELVEGEAARALAGRTPVLQRPLPERAPFVDELRGIAWLLLDRPAPLAERLYLIAFIAEEAEALIEAGVSEGLGAELESLLDEAALSELAAERLESPGPAEPALEAVFTQATRLRAIVRPRLRRRLDEALAAAEALAVLRPGGEEALRRRVASLPDGCRLALEAWLSRVAREQLFRELARPDTRFVEVAGRLSLRLALLRVLLACHPLAEAGPAALGALLVELVYGIARVAEHDAAARAFLAEDADRAVSQLASHKGLLALL